MSSIRYDATEELNMDSKAECCMFNLAHVAKDKKSEKNCNK